eukprot:scaffold24592_cov20-Prasinocladus_malaysianus.AAC.2
MFFERVKLITSSTHRTIGLAEVQARPQTRPTMSMQAHICMHILSAWATMQYVGNVQNHCRFG